MFFIDIQNRNLYTTYSLKRIKKTSDVFLGNVFQIVFCETVSSLTAYTPITSAGLTWLRHHVIHPKVNDSDDVTFNYCMRMLETALKHDNIVFHWFCRHNMKSGIVYYDQMLFDGCDIAFKTIAKTLQNRGFLYKIDSAQLRKKLLQNPTPFVYDSFMNQVNEAYKEFIQSHFIMQGKQQYMDSCIDFNFLNHTLRMIEKRSVQVQQECTDEEDEMEDQLFAEEQNDDIDSEKFSEEMSEEMPEEQLTCFDVNDVLSQTSSDQQLPSSQFEVLDDTFFNDTSLDDTCLGDTSLDDTFLNDASLHDTCLGCASLDDDFMFD